MQFGVVFPQTEIGTDISLIRDYVQSAEELGYDYLLAYDHVLGANPQRSDGWKGFYTHQDAFHEQLITFSYLAAITKRIQFVTGILILPQRQTALVAKQTAQLDLLSGGRLRLGLGIGWNEIEYQALNENFHNRGQRLDEQLEVLHELWTKPLVTFKGRYHHINDAGLNPMPIQQPIPLWFGGAADAVLRRTARWGQGYMPNPTAPEKLRPIVDTLHRYWQDAGRDPSGLGLDIRLSFKNLPQSEWQAEVQRWRDFGATHISFNTMGAGLSPREHLHIIQQFRQTLA